MTSTYPGKSKKQDWQNLLSRRIFETLEEPTKTCINFSWFFCIMKVTMSFCFFQTCNALFGVSMLFQCHFESTDIHKFLISTEIKIVIYSWKATFFWCFTIFEMHFTQHMCSIILETLRNIGYLKWCQFIHK